jgi:predicted MFS family arabinose efflux permease
VGWRGAFVLLAAITAVGALAAARWLPRERDTAPRRPSRPLHALRMLARRLDGRLVGTFTVGFNVLFAQVATFTYVTFHLAGPPFHLGTAKLSTIFVVYLVGALVTPFAGRWIDRVGARRVLAVALGTALAGAALTLYPSIAAIAVGLTLCCTAVFVSQSAATSFLQTAVPDEARSAAAGVYVACYYLGGSLGGLLPAAAWHLGGWPACVALVAAVQLVTIAVAMREWREVRLPGPAFPGSAAP